MRHRRILLIWLILPLLACGGPPTAGEFSVVRVADGDSITVADNLGEKHKIRISGIDAPELGQPYGRKSKQHLSQLLEGKQVRLEIFKTDKYGRLVAKVWLQPADCPQCGKTLDAGMAQLTTGMAWWYRYWSEEQGEQDRSRYEFAEQEARAKQAGLWQESNPVNPWQWRKMHPRR